MPTRTITSTEAQNNFGQIIDAVVQEHTRYIIKRRNAPAGNNDEFVRLSAIAFGCCWKRKKIDSVIRELAPVYKLGEAVNTSDE